MDLRLPVCAFLHYIQPLITCLAAQHRRTMTTCASSALMLRQSRASFTLPLCTGACLDCQSLLLYKRYMRWAWLSVAGHAGVPAEHVQIDSSVADMGQGRAQSAGQQWNGCLQYTKCSITSSVGAEAIHEGHWPGSRSSSTVGKTPL